MHAGALVEYYQATGKLVVARGNDSPSLYAQVRAHLEQGTASSREMVGAEMGMGAESEVSPPGQQRSRSVGS